MSNYKDKTNSQLGNVIGTAIFGAIIGGTAAAAKGIRQMRNDETCSQEVMVNVAKEAGSTAIAAGTAGAIVGSLKLGPVLSTVGVIAIATGTKYAMDSVMQPACLSVAPAPKKHAPLIMDTSAKEAKEEAKAAKKAAAKKSKAKKPPKTKEKKEKVEPKTDTIESAE